MTADRNRLLSEVESLLAYHKSIGICDYPRNKDIDDFSAIDSLHSSPSAKKDSENCTLNDFGTVAGGAR